MIYGDWQVNVIIKLLLHDVLFVLINLTKTKNIPSTIKLSGIY